MQFAVVCVVEIDGLKSSVRIIPSESSIFTSEPIHMLTSVATSG
jgi:hypothetical protein